MEEVSTACVSRALHELQARSHTISADRGSVFIFVSRATGSEDRSSGRATAGLILYTSRFAMVDFRIAG